jgi:hypothetical protein
MTRIVPFETFYKILRLCSLNDIGVFDFLLAAWYSVIYRYNEQGHLEILIRDATRCTAAGGLKPDCFDPVVYLKLHEGPETKFNSLVAAVKCTVDKAFETHQNSSCDAQMHIAYPDSSRNSSTRVYFGYSDGDYTSEKSPFVEGDSVVSTLKSDASYEIALEAIRSDADGLRFCLEYCCDYYDAEDMDRFLENYTAFVSSATTDFEQPVCELAMCGETELRRLRDQFWNMKVTDNLWDSHLFFEKFFHTTEKMPDSIALETPDGDKWTYSRLKLRAQQIKSVLEQQGVTPGQLVGILCEPNPDCIAGVLGILLTRCGYVPMEPDSPVDRLTFMTNDSGVRHIIVGESCTSVATAISTNSDTSIKLIPIEMAYDCVLGAASEPLNCIPSPEDPFYLIYTSVGSVRQCMSLFTHSSSRALLVSRKES